MVKRELLWEIQRKLSSGYRINEFKEESRILVISIENNEAVLEFEGIRRSIKNQLNNLKLMLRNEKTGAREEFTLGNIVKATIGKENSLDLTYSLRRMNK